MSASAPADAPVGIFDSGIGGLTVVAAVLRALPDERVTYLGDTARVPYGPKGADTVRRYSVQIAEWLVSQGVKAIVIACNTATAHALETVRAHVNVPVIGVIDPGADAAVVATRSGRIGVIGTSGTIASGAYERAIAARRADAHVAARACPLFVPLVEEGWTDHPATRLVAATYLEGLHDAAVDTLVLGCTHYPLLAPVIAEVMGPGVTLVDSAAETARALAQVLEARRLRAPSADHASVQHRFVATDAPDAFLRVGQRFLGAALRDVEVVHFT
ncbi:MAG: glutamate racemase [Gemmatimonadaceae bacterium]|nr:glutamate racemase [Gemmatimonadaceae bacterium]